MIKVTFYNLIRSKYRIDEVFVQANTVKEVIDVLCAQYPEIDKEDLIQAVLFINNEKVMHVNRFEEILKENDHIVFTNFVGGG